jgi:hypothetical protein
MRLRLQGKARHPLLMYLVLFAMRLCLAAYLVEHEDKALLGPKGHLLRVIIKKTHSAQAILRCLVRHSHDIVGIGGQSIVMKANDKPGYLRKYNYTLAGMDSSLLQEVVAANKDEQRDMIEHFGELVQPMEFGTAKLPLRGPLGKLVTLYGCQQQLHDIADIFSPESYQTYLTTNSRVRDDLSTLAASTRKWLKSDKWLDLVGPNNIVITKDFGEARIRIIDTGPYATEYLADVNPSVGKPYGDVILERLKTVETLLARTIPLLIILCATYLLGIHFHLIHSLGLIDHLEDAYEYYL